MKIISLCVLVFNFRWLWKKSEPKYQGQISKKIILYYMLNLRYVGKNLYIENYLLQIAKKVNSVLSLL